ncbi:unnamed protein product [Ostreobium quekettii]|uniref:Major facilitator superfamily (MFS) profile domain-containing protein n=1 Tax=Ostreobium quekettii TaxID=121088 RepID=A0A8S1JAI4_9CHLO|nr:unnamed protein product [Ostreobium quekettii]|eukprot:evm.model.scf_420.1 EVM.evm.TU.scf_420.1   scf_420:11520-17227(-)
MPPLPPSLQLTSVRPTCTGCASHSREVEEEGSPSSRGGGEGGPDRRAQRGAGMAPSELAPPGLAPGVVLLQKLRGSRFGYGFYQGMALVLTFLVYMSYHASRRPISIVKSALNPTGNTGCCGDDCDASGVQATLANGTDATGVPGAPTNGTDPAGGGDDCDGGWAPFCGGCGESRLGYLDTAFLISYTFGVMASGHIGDRTNLRHFLLFGMVGSGVMISLVGMAYFWNIHSYSYFLIFQGLTGVFEGTGWPAVVSVVAHWFGKGRRGLIMGIWNSHTSVGNMLGSFLAAAVVDPDWGYSFLVLAALITGVGVFTWLFLIPSPSDVFEAPGAGSYVAGGERVEDEEQGNYERAPEPDSPVKPPPKGINFMAAWAIPGVMSYSFALFFSKLVAYTFLFWLPFYLQENRPDLTSKQAGDLSIFFDLGGIFGGIAAGQLSDATGASASVATGFTLLAMPTMLAYQKLGGVSPTLNDILLVVTGFFVNAPYALITTAVSADLGTHESIASNRNALSTVTAIIDGMGSLGATVGPMLTGQILSNNTTTGAFNKMFVMLCGSSLLAGMLLAQQVWKEHKARRKVVEKATSSESREAESREGETEALLLGQST